MSCERMDNRILAYMHGRLKESEHAEVEKHLSTCAACRVRASEFRSVSELLDELPAIEPSPAFDVRVRARIAAEPARQSWWAWLRPSPRVALAAGTLLAAAVWVSYNSTVNPPELRLPAWAMSQQQVDDDLNQDLSVIEDHDTLSNFEPLKELPPPVDDDDQQQM
jgi:anti-sigma factor RsiW